MAYQSPEFQALTDRVNALATKVENALNVINAPVDRARIDPSVFMRDHGETAETTNVSTTPYTVVVTDQNVYVDCTVGVVTVNLPAATGSGKILTIKKIDAVANKIIVDAAGTDTIDGAATKDVVNQWDVLHIHDAATGKWYAT